MKAAGLALALAVLVASDVSGQPAEHIVEIRVHGNHTTPDQDILSIAALDVGQAVAVRGGAVVAVEAAEGTDAMIRRAGALAAGVVVVKVSRPQQDPRYDLPVVGPETVRALAEARGTALAVEAGRTILLDREQSAAAAAEAGIAVVAAASPPHEPSRPPADL